MRKIIVPKKYDKKYLNSFILNEFPSLNKNVLYKALRKKDIRINGVKISQNTLINSGDEITIYIVDSELDGIRVNDGSNDSIVKDNIIKPSTTLESYNIKIIFENENILIVYKPGNLSVTESSRDKYTLTSLLKKELGNNVEPCHRIDRNTKGLVLFSKTEKAHKKLLEMFKNGKIEKRYLAKVYGIPKKKHAILEAYLFKDSKKSMVYISDIPKKGYQKIITEYKVIKSDTKLNISTLDIVLHTGKTHQIRAHLAHIGHPILGDGKYGINKINKQFGYKTQELYSYSLKGEFGDVSFVPF
ncbi:MAG: RluA family pseudouridine synthase [Clostridia bacterium]|nr:RluA family pseudouridine synthase [Clostridia bacterium]